MLNATTTESNIPDIIASALSELIYSPKSAAVCPNSFILIMDIATADPKSSNTIDTVVDVGKPSVLKTSSKTTSVSITARNMIIISEK